MYITKWTRAFSVLAFATSLTMGSVSSAYADQKTKNTVTGAAIGAGVGLLIGNGTTAVVGAVLGGIVGSEVKK
jgi:outer membrane lipoprotein SlyB